LAIALVLAAFVGAGVPVLFAALVFTAGNRASPCAYLLNRGLERRAKDELLHGERFPSPREWMNVFFAGNGVHDRVELLCHMFVFGVFVSFVFHSIE
jgi:hypothetical protein